MDASLHGQDSQCILGGIEDGMPVPHGLRHLVFPHLDGGDVRDHQHHMGFLFLLQPGRLGSQQSTLHEHGALHALGIDQGGLDPGHLFSCHETTQRRQDMLLICRKHMTLQVQHPRSIVQLLSVQAKQAAGGWIGLMHALIGTDDQDGITHGTDNIIPIATFLDQGRLLLGQCIGIDKGYGNPSFALGRRGQGGATQQHRHSIAMNIQQISSQWDDRPLDALQDIMGTLDHLLQAIWGNDLVPGQSLLDIALGVARQIKKGLVGHKDPAMHAKNTQSLGQVFEEMPPEAFCLLHEPQFPQCLLGLYRAQIGRSHEKQLLVGLGTGVQGMAGQQDGQDPPCSILQLDLEGWFSLAQQACLNLLVHIGTLGQRRQLGPRKCALTQQLAMITQHGA